MNESRVWKRSEHTHLPHCRRSSRSWSRSISCNSAGFFALATSQLAKQGWAETFSLDPKKYSRWLNIFWHDGPHPHVALHPLPNLKHAHERFEQPFLQLHFFFLASFGCFSVTCPRMGPDVCWHSSSESTSAHMIDWMNERRTIRTKSRMWSSSRYSTNSESEDFVVTHRYLFFPKEKYREKTETPRPRSMWIDVSYYSGLSVSLVGRRHWFWSSQTSLLLAISSLVCFVASAIASFLTTSALTNSFRGSSHSIIDSAPSWITRPTDVRAA